MTTNQTTAEQLADFAIRQQDFPAPALNEGKRIILDQFACQIMFAVLPWSVAYLDAVKSLGTGTGATVVYHGDKLSLDQAAFVNSAFGHGGEFDDSQLGSNTHSGAVIVPTVMALAERQKLSGKDALNAVLIGVEVMVRVGAAAAPHLDEHGFHAPPVVGPFGAAAAGCRLLGLPPMQCVHAFGIAGSHSSGTREYTRSGGTMKRIHCAIPAMSGLRSAMMAAHGITGPRTIIDGDRGILQCFAGEFDLARVTNGLGRDYLFVESAYKPITSPWPAHAPLEAFGWLIDQHNLTPEQVAAIEVGTSQQAMNNVRTIKAPRDIMDAQYSLVYGLAVRLFRGGNKFRDYREEDLTDPRFAELSRKVTISRRSGLRRRTAAAQQSRGHRHGRDHGRAAAREAGSVFQGPPEEPIQQRRVECEVHGCRRAAPRPVACRSDCGAGLVHRRHERCRRAGSLERQASVIRRSYGPLRRGALWIRWA